MIRCQSNQFSLLEAGVLRSKPKDSLGQRLVQLRKGLVEVFEAHHPDEMSMEELYSHYERPQTAILMGHARGVYCCTAAEHDVETFNYAATQVKKVLTGNGRAPKAQMQMAVMQQFGLSEPPDPPDIADAMGIALCHHFLTRQTVISEMKTD